MLFLMGHYLNLLLQLSVNINTKHSNHWCKCCYETMKNTFCNSNMTLKIGHPNTLDNILVETDIVHKGSASLKRSVKQTNKKKDDGAVKSKSRVSFYFPPSSTGASSENL